MTMPNLTTIARPYARALFDVALENNDLQTWSTILPKLSLIASNNDMQFLYNDPRISEEQLVDTFVSIYGDDLTVGAKNLLNLLAEQHRLNALPEIATLFEAYKAAREKNVDVKVTSARPINTNIQKKLAQALQIRLQCAVNLEFDTDPNIIGGAVIRSGDLVIDGSVYSKLERLATSLIS